MDFWPFLWFWQNHKNGQKSIFYFERWKFFSTHLNHLGRQFFCIFYTFWFDQKKWAKSKKDTFAHGPFFQFLAQKCQKYQFSWKNLFLTIFLWVISVRKGFLYLWQTPIFEPARAILLRRVRYQALWMRVFGQKCQKYWFSWKKYFLWFFLWVISDQLAWNKWEEKILDPLAAQKRGKIVKNGHFGPFIIYIR